MLLLLPLRLSLMQTLFALNGQYWMNERAVALASTFTLCPVQPKPESTMLLLG